MLKAAIRSIRTMGSRFRKFDGWILDALSNAYGRIQRLTAIDCLRAARSVRRFAWLLFVADDIQIVKWGQAAFDSFILIVNTLPDEFDDQIRSEVASGFGNRRRMDRITLIVRYILAILTPHVVAHGLIGTSTRSWFFSVGSLLLTLATWLSCCDPRPSQKSKVSEWVAKAKRSFESSGEMTPVPVSGGSK